MFEDIDFLSGEVSFAFDEKIEDMLWVDYPNNYVLAMGWNEVVGGYAINIVRDSETGVPVARGFATNDEDMKKLLKKAIEKVEYESKRNKPHQGPLWKTEIIEL